MFWKFLCKLTFFLVDISLFSHDFSVFDDLYNFSENAINLDFCDFFPPSLLAIPLFNYHLYPFMQFNIFYINI